MYLVRTYCCTQRSTDGAIATFHFGFRFSVLSTAVFFHWHSYCDVCVQRCVHAGSYIYLTASQSRVDDETPLFMHSSIYVYYNQYYFVRVYTHQYKFIETCDHALAGWLCLLNTKHLDRRKRSSWNKPGVFVHSTTMSEKRGRRREGGESSGNAGGRAKKSKKPSAVRTVLTDCTCVYRAHFCLVV